MEREGRGVEFGSVLAILAGLTMIGAVLLFVAAGWEDIPRLGRVALLAALIAGGYLGGALLKSRGHSAFGEALWLVGAGAFGASIALVGQMYHLSGDETGVLLTWSIGTGLAAALLRSALLSVFAAALAAVWLVLWALLSIETGTIPWRFVPLAAGLWGVSLWAGSRHSRHLLLLAAYAFLVVVAEQVGRTATGTAIAAAGAILFLLAWLHPEKSRRWSGLGNAVFAHLFVLSMLGFAILQVVYYDSPYLAIPAAIALAAVVAALLTAGRLSHALRVLAYLAFAHQLVLVYSATIGTMLGTSGFFFVAALLLAALAVLITRIERRVRTAGAGEGGE